MALIGTKPHEVPSNAMLGKLAYMDGDGGIVYSAITAATTINGNDKCKLFDATSGTFTLSFISAANLPIDWKVYVRNSGAGTITLDPSGAETIDGVSTLSLFSGETRLIYSTGSALRSVLLDGDSVLNLTEEYTSGTSGATTTAATWTTMPINTVKVNRISGSSLGSNLITLPAGTYTMSYTCSLGGNVTTGISTRVWNNTTSAVISTSPSGIVNAAGSQISHTAVFSLTAAQQIAIQFYTTSGGTVGGTPMSIAATNEVYKAITIRKIA